jgi:hypothetical protein
MKYLPFFSSSIKRSLLHIFDELKLEYQKFALDFVKLLKKNREEVDRHNFR